MKKTLCVAMLLMSKIASAEDVNVETFEYVDVVETTDGSILKGVIVEQQPGVIYKVATADGSLHVIKAPEVVRLAKERNKLFRPTRVAALGSVSTDSGVTGNVDRSPGFASSFARTGLRVDVATLLVFPRGDIEKVDTSFAPAIRVGYEHVQGNVGIEGGGLVRFTYWQLPGDTEDAAWTLETHAYLRGSVHVGRVAPYADLTIGTDTNYVWSSFALASNTEVGFGMNLGFGVKIAAQPSLAIDLGMDYHPDTDDIDPQGRYSVEYLALHTGLALAF